MEKQNLTKRLLNKDMFISEAVSEYPEVVPIFLEYGLHCAGCFAAGMETILEGGLAHGMSEIEIDNMILDAKEAIAENNH